jgi:hypothetical protein
VQGFCVPTDKLYGRSRHGRHTDQREGSDGDIGAGTGCWPVDAGVAGEARQAQEQRDRVPVVFDFFDPCTGESVIFNGTVQVFFDVKEDANGGSHFQGHAYLHGQGVSASGAKYVLNETQNNHQNFNVFSESGAANFHITQSLRVIRVGSAGTSTDDFKTETLLQLTINANGEVTANVSQAEAECL